MNPQLQSQIEAALFESADVASVLAVRVAGEAGAELVGVRVSVLRLVAATDAMPVIANLRARIREIVPQADIFIEIDPTPIRTHGLATEAIVVRSMD